MALKLYNTRTKQKEDFAPIDAKAVRMYVCGPTVYDFAHIGNARPAIVFDVLFRLLRHLYGADHVVYARNITDVEDKINARAAEEGVSIRELTERTAAQYQADVAALGCLAPTIEPRATDHIDEMISLIERLIARGHAYEAEGHVLFEVASDPHYGSLARRSVDEMRAGARIEVAPYKRDPMDFVLWKPSEGADPGWESPWGFGRPGWHLECSAMAEKHLGEVFDIHGGGIDLLFPHHENEVAQSTCAHGTEIMAKIWMHNGHLQVEGAKMSKSLGNFITMRDLLTGWRDFRWSGSDIRLAMLSTHYRQPMDWSVDKLEQAAIFLDQAKAWASEFDDDQNQATTPEFLDALCDDLNTPQATAILHDLLKTVKGEAHGLQRRAKGGKGILHDSDYSAARELAANLRLLGIDLRNYQKPNWVSQPKIERSEVERLVSARSEARKAKNWAEADRIRDELAAMGIALKDAKNTVTGEIETTWEIAR
jgi:cysteinyl-tRNA synthetase